jgi:hypothetical protein
VLLGGRLPRVAHAARQQRHQDALAVLRAAMQDEGARGVPAQAVCAAEIGWKQAHRDEVGHLEQRSVTERDRRPKHDLHAQLACSLGHVQIAAGEHRGHAVVDLIDVARHFALRQAEEPAHEPVPRAQPLAREWTLIVDAPGVQACLAGWGQPSPRELADSERRFEVLWSFEPAVVQDAAAIAAEQIRVLAPALGDRLPLEREGPIAVDSPELRFATGLANRILGYLGAVSPTA